MVVDGESSRRALTTAMLDLASRGLISFREEKGILSHKVGIDVQPAEGDAELQAQRDRNARRPTGPAEAVALRRIRSLGRNASNYVSPEHLPEFGAAVDDFDKALEQHVVAQGWYAEAPSKVVSRYSGRAWLAIAAGIGATFAGLNIPISGLTMIGIAIIVAGIVMLLFAQAMPAVTKDGSVIRAMLAAYRRTLKMTMHQARSMQQVVDEASAAGMTWLDTPDQAIVWGTALGLQHEIEDVLSRSLEDVQQGRRRGDDPVLPELVHELERQRVQRVRHGGQRREPLLGLRRPRPGRDDVRARDDRELALVIGERGRRVLRWWRRRRRWRCRRRLLDPEQLATGVQPLDRDRRTGTRAPDRLGHPEALESPATHLPEPTG